MRNHLYSLCCSCVCNYLCLTYRNHNVRRFISTLNVSETSARSRLLNCASPTEFRPRLFYSADSKDIFKLFQNDSEAKEKGSKKEMKTYITLSGIDKNIYVCTIEEAKKLAARRNLKLVKVLDLDPKTKRAVYQLMTESQYLKQDDWGESSTKKEDKTIKGDKLVSFSSSTQEHDIITKVKMMKKWLAKKFEVRVSITGDLKAGENVYKVIEKEIATDGRLVQYRKKGSDIRFQILPPKVEKKKTASSEKENEKSEKEKTEESVMEDT